MNKRTIYGIITAGGAIGFVASFLEVLEYQQLLKNSHAALTCNLNSVFSCTNVLNAWQSKIFGFPNALLCMTFFALMFSTALVGLTGSTLGRKLRLTMHAIALFFLCFALWFFWQSTYHINALCILCIFCLTGLLMVNWGWLRLNAADLPISRRSRALLTRAIDSGADIFGWFILAAIVAFAMLIHFR